MDIRNLGMAGSCVMEKEFADMLDKRLSALLAEICDPQVPFTMSEDIKACTYCDFRMICGR